MGSKVKRQLHVPKKLCRDLELPTFLGLFIEEKVLR